MPIYEYVCMTCESHFEELVRYDDAGLACPDCGSAKLTRLLSAFVAHGTVGQPGLGESPTPVGRGFSGGGGCCGGGCGCG